MSQSKKIKAVNIICVVIFGSVLTYLNRNFRVDDALIYYRYIENFINGSGLVYNIGERFNAFTSPLYIYISVLASSVTKEVEITQLVLNGALLIASCITLIYIFDELKMSLAGFISSMMAVTAKYFYQVFGMETNLFILLSLLIIYFYFKGNFIALSFSSAFLLITRGEGLFLLLILFYFVYKERRDKLKFSLLLPAITVLAANSVFNYLYYGNFLPHTLLAKIYQGRSGFWDNASFVLGIEYLFKMFNKQSLYIVCLYLFAGIDLVKFYRNRFVMILLLFTVSLTVFYAIFNIPNYHWYYSFHFLTFFILVSLGIVKIIELRKKSFKYSGSVKFTVLLVFVYLTLTHLETARLIMREGPNENYKYMGEWFRNNTAPDTKIAAVEIGHIGWYSKRYIIDILGLTNNRNAEFLAHGKYDKWFDYYKPDYIIMHDPFWGQEKSIPGLVERGYFVLDSALTVKGFKIYKTTGKQ
jgi:hypothetical protein